MQKLQEESEELRKVAEDTVTFVKHFEAQQSERSRTLKQKYDRSKRSHSSGRLFKLTQHPKKDLRNRGLRQFKGTATTAEGYVSKDSTFKGSWKEAWKKVNQEIDRDLWQQATAAVTRAAWQQAELEERGKPLEQTSVSGERKWLPKNKQKRPPAETRPREQATESQVEEAEGRVVEEKQFLSTEESSSHAWLDTCRQEWIQYITSMHWTIEKVCRVQQERMKYTFYEHSRSQKHRPNGSPMERKTWKP